MIRRPLSFDISSSSTGWALLEQTGEEVVILHKDRIEREGTILDLGRYPDSYLIAAHDMADEILQIADLHGESATAIVIEEINLGKSRYSQRILEFTHAFVIDGLRARNLISKVVYLDSSAWRKALDLKLNAEQKRANGRLARAKRKARQTGVALDKKKVGVRGKTGKKHLSVAYCNERFGLALLMKDDDVADALCLGCAWLAGAEICDGR